MRYALMVMVMSLAMRPEVGDDEDRRIARLTDQLLALQAELNDALRVLWEVRRDRLQRAVEPDDVGLASGL